MQTESRPNKSLVTKMMIMMAILVVMIMVISCATTEELPVIYNPSQNILRLMVRS